jgi:hypothetical protein
MVTVERWADLPSYEGIFMVSDKGRVRTVGRHSQAVTSIIDEQWRDIPGYEGIYRISDQGRILSRARIDSRGHHRAEVLLSPRLSGPQGKQYLAVALFGAGNGVQRKLHRLVLESFAGPCPEGAEGCHNNGDKLDNRLCNLRWDTPSANNQDKRTHGTHNQVNKTHCPRGHEYTLDNCYDPAMKHRRCITCVREKAREQHYRKMADPILHERELARQAAKRERARARKQAKDSQ